MCLRAGLLPTPILEMVRLIWVLFSLFRLLSESDSDPLCLFFSGETFVFKLSPEVVFYKWSKVNAYYALAKEDSLSVGGGYVSGLCLYV